jgi:hypothetical protein
MPMPSDYLDDLADPRKPSSEPFIMPWPMPGNLGGLVAFERFHQWRDFILDFGLQSGAPRIVAVKFERAQKLYVLAWLDFDVVKAGELVAFTALELALKDRYGFKIERQQGKSLFFDQLIHMVTVDGLDEPKVPMNHRCGYPSKVIPFITGEIKPSLSDIRNQLAHGEPFDGFPRSGLLELIRDLIDYLYRGRPLYENYGPELSYEIEDTDT